MDTTTTTGTTTPTLTITQAAPNTTTTAPTTSEPVQWTSGLSEDYKGWVQNKGFKDANQVVESYKNFEKLMGAPKEKILRLPDKEDDPAWNEIHTRLGRPEKADDYDLKSILNEDFAKFNKQAFHELGITKKQGETLANKWKEYHEKTAAEQQSMLAAKSVEEENSLKKEWGAAFEQKSNIAARAAKEFGLDAETVDKLEQALGFTKVVKLMADIGSKLGEDSYVGGKSGGNSNVMTPGMAQARINQLMGDPGFALKYSSGDIDAKTQMDNLHKMAYPTI